MLIIACPTLQCCLEFPGEDAALVFISQHQKAIKAAFSEQRWILGSAAPSFLSSESSAHLLGSALPSLTSSLPSRLAGHRRLTLVYLHIPSLCLVESVTVCQSLKLKENLRTLCSLSFSLSLSQSAHCILLHWLWSIKYTLHAEFALTQRNKIIKDSFKSKKEISIAQGHYKGSACKMLHCKGGCQT